MKKLRSLLSMVLVAALVLSLGMTSMASDLNSDTSLYNGEAVTEETAGTEDTGETVSGETEVSGSVADAEDAEVSEANDQETDIYASASVSVSKAKDKHDEDSYFVNLKAYGSEDAAAEGRMYFWNYDGKLKGDEEKWDDLLTDPCTDVTAADLDKNNKMDLPIIKADGTEGKITAKYVEEKDEKGNLTGVYLQFTLPAGASIDTDIELALVEDEDADPAEDEALSEDIEEAVLAEDAEDADIDAEAEDVDFLIRAVILNADEEEVVVSRYGMTITAEAEEVSDEEIGDKDTEADAETEEDADVVSDENTIIYDNVDEETVNYDAAMSSVNDDYGIAMASASYSEDELWWIDDAYVGISGTDVTETNDFSLKYEFEFHTSRDLAAGTVEIKMNAVLGVDRDGNYIVPDDIGVPYGTPDNYTETSSSPFNYYYADENGNIIDPSTLNDNTYNGEIYIVFWNYETIKSGDNAVIQILYKELNVMQIPDMTTWEFTPEATVTEVDDEGNLTENSETVEGTPLTGTVDTQVTLTNVTKTAYTASGQSYTPELYTESQVESYIYGSLPDKYSGDNFSNYKYVVWQVDVRGYATQAWELDISDVSSILSSSVDGEVVGYLMYTEESNTYKWDYSDGLTISSTVDRDIVLSFYVVTAYPADEVEEDTDTLENKVTVEAIPVDGIDATSSLEDSADMTWSDYEWDYEGDVIGITKDGSGTYSPYLELLKLNLDKGTDTGEFYYSTTSACNGYGITHYTLATDDNTGENTLENMTDNENGNYVGEYIDGTYYEVVTYDDVLYAYPNNSTENAWMMDYDDYYFSSVTVTQTDIGYDVWEDAADVPESNDAVDQSIKIYAKFGLSDDPDEWTLVATVAWDGSGVLTYTFTDEDIAKEPYRVKVVHDSINYRTTCQIDVGVTLKGTSTKLKAMYTDVEDLTELQIEDISGVSGQYMSYVDDGDGSYTYTTGDYFQDTSVTDSNNYAGYTWSDPTLETFTKENYGTILMRDNAYVYLDGLTPHANATKNVSLENDTAGSRVLADYWITAYEGYYVSNEETVEALKELGISLPERNEVSFYDLLPYGMNFNGSVEVTAGRLTYISSENTSWQTNVRAWDTSDVTVTVEADDIINNWEGTGRTMVIFHVEYTGDELDTYSYFSAATGMWEQGYGIHFQAYYDWTDMDEVDSQNNICAYVAENVENENDNLLGQYDTEVHKDDGSADNLDSSYNPLLVEDLNGDEVTDLYTNMYAEAITSTNVATSANDDIQKTVRSDADVMAEYGLTTTVELGATYTYKITLTNTSATDMSNIVLFDHLENSLADGRYDAEYGINDDTVFTQDNITNPWVGTLLSVITSALEDAGINAVVYLNADRNATITDSNGTTEPDSILTETNGWYTVEKFGSISNAQSIAVDVRYKKDGSQFVLTNGESISFEINMRAPSAESNVGYYAFNNVSYYSTNGSGDAAETATVSSDTVRVGLATAGQLIAEKKFADGTEVPEAMQNTDFTFQLTDGDSDSPTPLAYQEYTLQTYNEDTGLWENSTVIRSTDGNGYFTLKAGQRAVFYNLTNYATDVVTEVDDIFWTSSGGKTSTTEEETNYYLYYNTYRSPVYFYKTALTTDAASDKELEEAVFSFKIYIDKNGDGDFDDEGELFTGSYDYVDQALTNGLSPNVTGTGTTADDGTITLKIGEIIAFYPTDSDGDKLDVSYEIVETSTGESWVCTQDTVTGTTQVYGSASTISNVYKYRNLILTKSLEDYDKDESECTDSWTFQIEVYDEETKTWSPLTTNNSWYMIDANGDRVYDDDGNAIEGTLETYKIDDVSYNATFTFTGAGSGRRIVIEGLVAGETYRINEINYDKTLYETINGGSVETSMPMYVINRAISISNEYRYRDLSVSKLVLSSNADADLSNKTFTFTLEKKNGESSILVTNQPYTIKDGDGTIYYTDTNGQFTLKSGETAVFDDIGYVGDEYIITETADDTYTQVYPANGEAADEKLSSDGASVRFVNGDYDSLVTIQKDIVGLDDVGDAFVDWIKGDNTREVISGDNGDSVYSVDVTFGVYDANGDLVATTGQLTNVQADGDNPSGYPYTYIYITQSGDVTIQAYNGGELTKTLSPYDAIYISGIEEGYTVKASEPDDLIRVLYDVTEETQEAIDSSSVLGEGDVMSGEAEVDGTITLVNNFSSANVESEIYKEMTEDSAEVSTGAQITFIVEIYDSSSGTWTPASGIRYIMMDDSGATSGVLTTGSDGKITLTKTDNGYPYIRFIENEVYANVNTGMEDGTLRIVETTSGTDSEWGSLVGYDGENWEGGPSLNITWANTFVNGNDNGLLFEVEKVVTGSTDDDDTDFVFQLNHVLAASQLPIESSSDILESEVGAGVFYTVYDADTGDELYTAYTDDNGQFTLKDGQYAVFEVPADTIWTVYETVTPGYELNDVDANTDDAPNAMLIDPSSNLPDGTTGIVQNPDPNLAYATGNIVLTLTDADDLTPISGAVYTLYIDGVAQSGTYTTDANGQVTVNDLPAGTYYFVETTVPSNYMVTTSNTSDTVTIPEDLIPGTTYKIEMTNTKKIVRYAVSIYGIQTDTYSVDGGTTLKTAGLTFGPATGATYAYTYKSHLSDVESREEYESHRVTNPSDYCIHWMTWDEIAEQSLEDPTVFQSCLENGCTKSVELNLNSTIKSGDADECIYMTGDGAGSLYLSIATTYKSWNNYTNSSSNAGGWPASKIRATLNGSDGLTNTAVAGSTLLNSSNCLFSCFPSDLQSAIVPKAVSSDTDYSSTSASATTTYDNLWLFSANELGGNVRSNEGSKYKGVRTDLTAYRENDPNGNLSDNPGGAAAWWLRTVGLPTDTYSTYSADQIVYEISGNAFNLNATQYATQGLSPGFCIK